MTEKYQPIPHRLKNMAVGGHVAGAEDIDAGNGKTQQDINVNTYRKNETYSKEQLNNMITTPEQEYLSVTATAETTDVDDIAALIATKYPDGKESADTVYRVGCWDGEQYDTGVYTEYVWDGIQYIPVGIKNPGIDDEPVPESDNLVKSGGIFPIKFNASELELLTDFDVVEGGYLRVNSSHPEGEFVSNSSYQIWVFPIIAGNCYTFSNYAGAAAAIKFVHWLSSYDISGDTPNFTVVSAEPYGGNGSTPVTCTDQPIKAPSGAVYAAVNVFNTRADRDYSIVNFKAMKDVQSASLQSLVQKNQAVISESIRLTPSSVVRGKFLLTSGEYQTASYYNTSIYDVIGGNKYLLDAYALAKNAGVYVLFWLDSEQNILLYQYTSTSTEDLLLKKEIVQAPTNAVYAAINIRTYLTAEYSFSELGEYIDVESINNEIRNKADIAAISEKIAIEPVETFSGKFFKRGGTCASLGVMSILKFPIDENTVYSFTGKYPKGITTNFIAWLNSDGEIIDNKLEGFMYAEPYKGSLNEAVSYYQQEVTSPAGAMYAVMNTRSGYSYHFYKTGDVINISELKSRVDNTNLGLMEVTITGNPKTIGSSIIIRTSYDSDNDIVTVYHRYANNNITPLESYLGSKSLTTSSLMASANKFHSWGDSTSPLRNGTEAPWHMFAQHGYDIPSVVCEHSLTDSDLNTTWTDNEGRSYKIGKISGNTLYLLPTVIETEIPNVYTRSWKAQTVENPILTLTKDGTTLTITSQSNTQIRPIQSSKEFKILADGVEISKEGIYRCNDLIISETLECFNPFTVETWYPTPVCNTVAMELVQSFNIHGLSHRYDAIINMKEPLIFGAYGTSQAQCLVSDDFSGLGSIVTGYDAYVMVPKVKKTVNGNRADIPHTTSSSSDDIDAYRNTTSLYDADDLPDREITYLYDGENYLAGFATGVSLTKGLSVKEKRNLYVPTNALALSMSYSNRNKFYLNILRKEAFENNVLPAGFTASFSAYWAYFNPNVNKGQVYWYKDGKDYIIYAHYQDANNNLAVTLPSEMDGLSFEVVEKTDGVTLITDNIVNGKIYLNTDNSDHNYIVLKTK